MPSQANYPVRGAPCNATSTLRLWCLAGKTEKKKRCRQLVTASPSQRRGTLLAASHRSTNNRAADRFFTGPRHNNVSRYRERTLKIPRSFALPTACPVLATLFPANRAYLRRIPLKPMYNCTWLESRDEQGRRVHVYVDALDRSFRSSRHRSPPTTSAPVTQISNRFLIDPPPAGSPVP